MRTKGASHSGSRRPQSSRRAQGTAPGAAVNSGGEGASWRLPPDLDFFTRDGDTYAAAGSYIYEPNGGGQTIVRLTEGGAVTPETSPPPSSGRLRNSTLGKSMSSRVPAAGPHETNAMYQRPRSLTS